MHFGDATPSECMNIGSAPEQLWLKHQALTFLRSFLWSFCFQLCIMFMYHRWAVDIQNYRGCMFLNFDFLQSYKLHFIELYSFASCMPIFSPWLNFSCLCNSLSYKWKKRPAGKCVLGAPHSTCVYLLHERFANISLWYYVFKYALYHFKLCCSHARSCGLYK